MKPGRARAMTALGLGLAVAAPAAAWGQQQQQVQPQQQVQQPAQQQQGGACLERVEEIQSILETPQDTPMPDLSHLVEAARRFAAEGQEEQCLRTVDDMDEYLGRVARLPGTGQTGAAVQPDVPPPVEAVEGTGRDDGDSTVGRAGDAAIGDALGTDRQGVREAVSPVEPPAPGVGTGTTTETTETFADVSPDELRVDRIVGQPLLNNWARKMGEIVDVVVARDDPDQAYAVVSREGGLLGGDEGLVVIEFNRLRMVHQEGIQFFEGQDSPSLDDMPAYDPTRFQSLSQQQPQQQQQQQQPTGGTGAGAGAGGG